MSENEQEGASTAGGTPPAPGHQGGPAPVTEPKVGQGEDVADEAAAGTGKLEPHAGLDK